MSEPKFSNDDMFDFIRTTRTDAMYPEQKLLINCPRCLRENFALAVITGKCGFCGFDANKEER